MLGEIDWSEIYVLPKSEINTMWNTFAGHINTIFETRFPLEDVKITPQSNKIKRSPLIRSLKTNLDFLFVAKTHDSTYAKK